MKDETRQWIEKAESDFEQAKMCFEELEGSYTGFWLQQSVEKALKSILIEEKGDYPYTHDLVEISKELDVPEKHLDYFPVLNTVYVSSRYPGAVDEKPENIEELIEDIEELLKWTREKL